VQLGVRPRRHDDLVLAPSVDDDHRDAGCPALVENRLHAGVSEARQRLVRELVLADAADKGDACAEAGRGDRLIRAFSARIAVEGPVREGLPRPWQPLAARDQVEVDGAYDA
jgi:hypothetical protein